MPDREVVPGLASRLKTAREAVRLSQQEAGEKAGVHHVSIARFETDKRVPTLSILYKLAAAYGVDVCDLLPRPDENHTPAEKKPSTKRTGGGKTKGK